MGTPVEVTIESLGAQGDGLAETERGRVFVPLALSGERVRVEQQAAGDKRSRLVEILEPSPDRREGPCPHFPACGGCTVQHLVEPAYRAWKRELLIGALSARGLVPDQVDPVAESPPAARRRVSLAVRKRGDEAVVGFNERGRAQIVDLSVCLVSRPAITALFEPLRRLMAVVLDRGGKADVEVTAIDRGLDVLIVGDIDWTLDRRQTVTDFAAANGIVRISWLGEDGEGVEPLFQQDPPTVRFGPVRVALPPGAFLQATAEAEEALAAFAVEALAGRERIEELFAGCGAFTFRLAEAGHRVRAHEGDRAAVDAMNAAAASAGYAGGRLDGFARDLARRPLAGKDLASSDAVLLDPPRSGALPQMEPLAASGIEHVVYVSCNPVTFARDAAILVEGGFRMRRVLPVDQFLWTGHLELAAVLERA